MGYIKHIYIYIYVSLWIHGHCLRRYSEITLQMRVNETPVTLPFSRYAWIHREWLVYANKASFLPDEFMQGWLKLALLMS